ncbi:MAG TPA: DUF2117 domain-containing protein [Candidatus Bathyarchaeia archaeon]|nr:DUF2117 domain-containing protein [Candidatus Bathyarchaeia archaeon]
MKPLGLLIHGPEILDEGEAEEAIETLKEAGFELEAALGGISGKTAVIDADMQHVIDISKDMKPSEVVDDFLKQGINFILLVNHAKTEESGFILGEGILRNFLKRGRAKENLSFVQLEYSSKVVIRWLVKPGDENIYGKIMGALSEFKEKEPNKLEARCRKDLDLVYREIRGVHPGEKIVVDGVIIGTVSDESRNNSVTLVAKEGKLVKVLGGTLIKHNLEKLPPLDLEKEMIKTARVIRRTKPKRVERDVMSKKGKKKKIACFFYTVETLFPKLEDKDADVEVAVTIGDDTTSIAGDILKRFGIRMIGITDGDADGLIAGIESGTLDEYAKFLPPDSLIIRLKPERDDIIGKKVKEAVFKGGDEIELEGEVEAQFEELKHRIFDLAKEDIIGVLNSSTARSQMKKAKNL